MGTIDRPASDVVRGIAANNKSAFSGYMMAVAVIGFSCHNVCGIMEFSPSLYPSPTAEAVSLMSSLSNYIWLLRIAILAALAFLSRKIGSLYTRKPLVLAIGASCAVGSILLFCCGYGDVFIPAGVVVGRILQSTTVGFLVLWCEVLCLSDTRKTTIVASLSYGLSFAFATVLANCHSSYTFALMALLPFASAVLLVLFSDEDPEKPVLSERLSVKEFPLKPFVAVGVFGLAQLLITAISEQRTSDSVEMNTVIGGIIGSVLLFAVLSGNRPKLNLVTFYRFVTPMLVCIMLMVLVAEPGAQKYEPYGLGATYAIFRVFAITLWCYSAMNTAFTSGFVVSVAQIVLIVFNRFDDLILGVVGSFGLSQGVLIAVVIIAVIAASAFLMPERIFMRSVNAASVSNPKTNANPIEHQEECILKAAAVYGLTPREQDICRLVLRGQTSDEICSELYIAPGTLKAHMRNIYGKAAVHSRHELICRIYETNQNEITEEGM